MLKTTINKILMLIYFISGALILEAITFNMLSLGTMPEYFWYNFSIILFLAVIVFAIPNYTAQYVVYTIILTLQLVFIYINYSLLVVYGDLFSFDMFSMLGEAGTAMNSKFMYVSVILQLVAVYFTVVILGGLALKYCRKETINKRQHFSVFNVIILIVVQCFSIGYFNNTRNNINSLSSISNQEYLISDKFLMNTSFLKSSSYAKFGTYGYFANMISNQLRNESEAIKNATVDYFNASLIYGEGENKSEVFGVDEGNNVIVIMMESVEWLTFGDGTYDKELNNLSYELTPNVYSLIYGDDYLSNPTNENNDSIISRNFFAKAKTNISEGIGLIGNYPVSHSLHEIVKKDSNGHQALGYALPNVLKNLGYTTTYVHSNYISFYDRNLTHNHLGFDNVVGKDTLTDKNGNYIYTGDDLLWEHWAAEADFVNNAIDYIVPTNYNEKPFYSFYLNVSSHGAYDYNENEVDCLKYKNYVKYGADDCVIDSNGYYVVNPDIPADDLTLTTWYQNVLDSFSVSDPSLCDELLYYQCGVVALDNGIKIIKQKLKDYGIEDKTTMLLYADHYSYYEGLSNRFKGFDLEDNISKDLNTIPMIISSPGVKKLNETLTDKYIINDRFCSAYDIVPTLLDLLGVKFNENLYMGHSLFRPADYVYTVNGKTVDMVVYYSNTGGLFSNDIYSFDLRTFVTQNNVGDSALNLFRAECVNILTKINYLNLLNKYNLYYRITNK